MSHHKAVLVTMIPNIIALALAVYGLSEIVYEFAVFTGAKFHSFNLLQNE